MTGKVRVEGPAEFGLTGDLGQQRTRADFTVDDFARLVDSQGARLAWARAMRCPCAPLNAQTAQPNPNCPICREHPGWTYFGPDNYEIPPAVGNLDRLQTALVAQYGASVIRGVLTGMNRRDQTYTQIGPWTFGTGTVTVRPENVLSINDRLVDLDSEISYSEVVEVEYQRNGQAKQIVTRYPVVSLNKALSLSGATVSEYRLTRDLLLSPTGKLSWRPGQAPPAKTRVSISYLCHAHWRVTSHPHVLRRTQVKTRVTDLETPLGSPRALPLQASISLEFLTEEP